MCRFPGATFVCEIFIRSTILPLADASGRIVDLMNEDG